MLAVCLTSNRLIEEQGRSSCRLCSRFIWKLRRIDKSFKTIFKINFNPWDTDEIKCQTHSRQSVVVCVSALGVTSAEQADPEITH
jgi:hypothetical protein